MNYPCQGVGYSERIEVKLEKGRVGVVLYVQETSLSASMCDNLTGCEAVFVTVLCWQGELITGVCYRCPCC